MTKKRKVKAMNGALAWCSRLPPAMTKAANFQATHQKNPLNVLGLKSTTIFAAPIH